MKRTVIAVGWFLAGCASTAAPGSGSPDAAVPGPDAPIGMQPDASRADAPPSAIDQCFPGLQDPSKPHPNYTQFDPIVNADCTGTNYQAISGVQRVVFLGDSITAGTPPTLPTDYYRTRVGNAMRAKFGLLTEIEDCSAWGARADDLLLPPNQQIHECFDTVNAQNTLVVMTVGGNDMNSIAGDASEGDTPAQTMAKVDLALGQLEDAVRWLKDPAHFPNGSYVVFANIYEFTDATGDLLSCPAAALAGYSGMAAPQMTAAYLHATEQYMRIAVDHQADMVFSLENFCGHGFRADDPSGICYRGPGTETWFDLTCIHPNPTGHAELARLFSVTIED